MVEMYKEESKQEEEEGKLLSPRECTFLLLLKSYIFNQNTKQAKNPLKCSELVEFWTFSKIPHI